MPDIFQLLSTWKKQILFVVLLSLIVATAIVFILPSKYLAAVTAVPSNPLATDKSMIFSKNIRELYSSLGEESDLDMIVGTGQLDTIYIAVAKKFRLTSFYAINDSSAISTLKAARILKKHTKITKTEFGELQVRVWCADKELAPELANSLMDELGAIHQDILNRNNATALRMLEASQEKLRDSIRYYESNGAMVSQQQMRQAELNALLEQSGMYQRLINEYTLMVNAGTPAIHIVERARISDQADSPKKALIIVAAGIAGLLFALWLAVLLEKRKQPGK